MSLTPTMITATSAAGAAAYQAQPQPRVSRLGHQLPAHSTPSRCQPLGERPRECLALRAAPTPAAPNARHQRRSSVCRGRSARAAPRGSGAEAVPQPGRLRDQQVRVHTRDVSIGQNLSLAQPLGCMIICVQRNSDRLRLDVLPPHPRLGWSAPGVWTWPPNAAFLVAVPMKFDLSSIVVKLVAPAGRCAMVA
jgi:hypothetical protein